MQEMKITKNNLVIIQFLSFNKLVVKNFVKECDK